jgi:hypothetical protein
LLWKEIAVANEIYGSLVAPRSFEKAVNEFFIFDTVSFWVFERGCMKIQSEKDG